MFKKLLLIIITIFFVFSCATSGGAVASNSGRPDPLYYGEGTGNSSLEAMAAAKGDAIVKAAFDLLGIAAATVKEAEIRTIFEDPQNVNLYVDNGSMDTLDNGSNGGSFYYKLAIRVNLENIAATLKRNTILGGQVDGRTGVAYLLPDQKIAVQDTVVEKDDNSSNASNDTVVEKEDVAPVDNVEISAEDRAFINDFIDNLTFMVYFDEDQEMDTFLAKSAVTQANSLLASRSIEFIDLDQIESLKADQELVYEENTGESVSLIMWIARKLHADIYIELSAEARGSSKGSNHYGEANIALTIFESSTADGKGSATYSTNPPAFSTVSEEAAINNAVTSATYKALEHAIEMVYAYYDKALVDGLKYELIIQNTEDSRLMRDFMKSLERHRSVKSVERDSYSPEETRYTVKMLGEIEDLEDAVYDVSEDIRGLEDIYMVYSSGSSITFDSGQ